MRLQQRRDLRAAVVLLPAEAVAWFLCVLALEDHISITLDCVAAIVSAGMVNIAFFYTNTLHCQNFPVN